MENKNQAHAACKSAVENIEKENGLKQIKYWLMVFYPGNYKYPLDYFETWDYHHIGTPDGNRAHRFYKSYMPDSTSMLKYSLTASVFHSAKLTRRIPDIFGELTNLKELALLDQNLICLYLDLGI